MPRAARKVAIRVKKKKDNRTKCSAYMDDIRLEGMDGISDRPRYRLSTSKEQIAAFGYKRLQCSGHMAGNIIRALSMSRITIIDSSWMLVSTAIASKVKFCMKFAVASERKIYMCVATLCKFPNMTNIVQITWLVRVEPHYDYCFVLYIKMKDRILDASKFVIIYSYGIYTIFTVC